MWKIYYDDGTTFSDQDGPPDEAPCMGVQVITSDDIAVGKALFHRKDYYWHLEDEDVWVGGDLFGLFDYLQQEGKVKFGRTISQAHFQRIMDEAMVDPYIGPKTAWYEGER